MSLGSSIGAANSARSPPPCGEGLGVGVVQWHATAIQNLRLAGLSDAGSLAHSWHNDVVVEDTHRVITTTPTPNPSPQGGGE